MQSHVNERTRGGEGVMLRWSNLDVAVSQRSWGWSGRFGVTFAGSASSSLTDTDCTGASAAFSSLAPEAIRDERSRR